jgi:hypothetical protein
MQVQYQLTLDDVIAFNQYHFSNSNNAQRGYWVNQAWGVFIALVLSYVWRGWHLQLRVMAFALISLLWMVGYHFYHRWWITHSARSLYGEGQNKGVLGNHIIALDADGVIEISDVGESRTSWDGIERIEENDKYFFLYTSAVMAHVIPKRAFLNEGESAEFLHLAQAYHSGTPRLTTHSTRADGA